MSSTLQAHDANLSGAYSSLPLVPQVQFGPCFPLFATWMSSTVFLKIYLSFVVSQPTNLLSTSVSFELITIQKDMGYM